MAKLYQDIGSALFYISGLLNIIEGSFTLDLSKEKAAVNLGYGAISLASAVADAVVVYDIFSPKKKLINILNKK